MLTVEPVIFFYSYGLLMNVPIYQQYVYYRLSEERGFPYSFQEQKSGCGSKTLNDSMEKLEKEVETKKYSFYPVCCRAVLWQRPFFPSDL